MGADHMKDAVDAGRGLMESRNAQDPTCHPKRGRC